MKPADAARSSGRWTLLIACIFLAQLIWLGAYSAWDPDTWWHIKTGELILGSGSIPRTDPYSYVLAGREWITFEWLFQVLAYQAYAAGAETGLSVLKVLVLSSAFLLLFRLAGGGFWAALLLSFAALTARPYFLARPQIFDYLFLALYLDLLDRSRERPGPTAALLPFLQALWVNLHGGAALIGLGIVGLKALSLPFFPHHKEAQRWSPFTLWTALTAACAAAMLLNPHGVKIFSHTFATLAFPGKELIAEWAPLRSFLSWEGSFLAMGVLAAAFSWRSDRHLSLLAVVLAFMGMRQTRHLPLAILAIAPLAARALARLKPVPQGPKSALSAVLGMALLSGVFILSHSTYLTLVGRDMPDLPDHAIRYLDENKVGGRMFNPYNLGGYLIWKTWPRRKVFVDGRNVEYGPRFIHEALRWHLPDGWKRLDDRWKFDYAFIGNGPAYRAKALDDSPDWALVFWDDAALVYLRRTPGNDSLIVRDAYRLLQPNRVDFGYLDSRGKADAALAELDRAVRGSPLNVNASQMRAYLLGGLGRHAEALQTLEALIEKFPLKPGPYSSLGSCYEQMGDHDAARKAYERGLRVSRWAHDRISSAHLRQALGRLALKRG